MKKLLLATVAMFVAAPAFADAITLTATVDGSLVTTLTSADGTLDVSNQSFGPDYNLNSLDINAVTFLTPPDILKTNTLDVNQLATGIHQLVIDVTASDLHSPLGLVQLLSEFSVTGLTTGWSAKEETFINGLPLSATPTFTINSAAVDVAGAGNLSDPYTAGVRYTINSDGFGSFNGGIDIQAAAVPGPIAGAGIPGFAAAVLWALGCWRRRRKTGGGLPA